MNKFDHFMPSEDSNKGRKGWDPRSTDSMFATLVSDALEKDKKLDHIGMNVETLIEQNKRFSDRLGSLENDKETLLKIGTGVGKVGATLISVLVSVCLLILSKMIDKI